MIVRDELTLVALLMFIGFASFGFYKFGRHKVYKELRPEISKSMELMYWQGYEDGEKAGLQEARVMRED